MTRLQLIEQIRVKKSFLCVGLDTDLDKIPQHLLYYSDPLFEFNKRIIDATKSYCVAYKPNIAFYESLGPKGWESLEKTMAYIPENIFTIADAKRGDIGNTSKMYAKTFFEYFDFDAITVAPYMGEDSITPFLEYTDKWVILLGLTSNKGSKNFQFLEDKKGIPFYEHVITQSQSWGNPKNLMYVIGATHPEAFSHIRSLAEDYFFLVPGVGAQGGDISEVMNYGYNKDVGLLINSSRNIIYADNGPNFEKSVEENAFKVQHEMKTWLDLQGLFI